MTAAHELRALATYHEDSGEPFTPEAMRQLAAKWEADEERARALAPAIAGIVPPAGVTFVLIGRDRAGFVKHVDEPRPARVIHYLNETDSAERVLEQNRRSYTGVRFARATTTYELVDVATVEQERDR